MFTFTVKPDQGDSYQLNATARDVLAWERGGRDRTVSRLMQNTRLTDAYIVAHAAAKRLGLFDGPLASFEESVDLVLGVEVEDEPDPTPPAL
jgi:hypothetical protein